VLDAAGDRSVLLITHRAEGLDRMDDVVQLDAGGELEDAFSESESCRNLSGTTG
jgi:ABC-type transport system involved in cytochrome bd biosynthesis fused ATPase/permease subunit